MNNAFLAYYRCPEELADLRLSGPLEERPRFFSSDGAHYYGRKTVEAAPADSAAGLLNFDPDEIAENCRSERYLPNGAAGPSAPGGGIVRALYYAARPLLPVAVRKHLQRAALRGWEKKEFPRWPVGLTVETLMKEVATAVLRKRGEPLPFVWFWPDGFPSCLIMTHDVEAKAGRDFCGRLMDVNDSFGIKSSFQVVPERRYAVSPEFLESIRARGFEVNVHGLCHDGKLFENREEFSRRARLINEYGKRFGAAGFRSPVMYRKADWMGELDFDYDMSFPNVAHLDPQRGGCATVMPYFLGKMVELPLTMLQDYTVFHILRERGIDIWRRQIGEVRRNNGLLSFIVHPDYIVERRYREIYEALLRHLRGMIQRGETLPLLPREASAWWRARDKMRLALRDGRWEVLGEGSERARVAWAEIRNGEVVYRLDAREPEAPEASPAAEKARPQ